jgi:hypothetical protein
MVTMPRLVAVATLVWLMSVMVAAAPQNVRNTGVATSSSGSIFETSDTCFACHNGLRSATGEDVSISSEWRATMMANSARDPYWQASVRREIVDHPTVREEIEDECSVCHMPMERTSARLRGASGQVFANLPVTTPASARARQAHDGVSCAVCHQIGSSNFGSPESFTGGYAIDTQAVAPRPIFGPFQIDAGHATIMRSSTGYKPTEATHVQQSELCATCHTLYTKARGTNGEVIGTLPEQMPYLEWKHSSLAQTKSCQTCHMPASEDTPITSVLGQPRRLARHQFRGGNSFMLRLLGQNRGELGVIASMADLDRAAERTREHLQSETASIAIARTALDGNRLQIDVSVQNRSGHKFPTGYPSRRVWIHLTVRSAEGTVIFESGAPQSNGAIGGNDHDATTTSFEPHYREIRRADEVQIYESIMSDQSGKPTTGLLTGVRYLKDNRLLPPGFQKSTAPPDIAVIGDAATDDDFAGGEDRVRYIVDAGAAAGSLIVDAELRFQTVGFRWADNLKSYTDAEPQRFGRYYRAMAAVSSERVAGATATVSR